MMNHLGGGMNPNFPLPSPDGGMPPGLAGLTGKDDLGADLGTLGPMGSLGTLFHFGKRDNEDTLQQIDDMLQIDQFVQVRRAVASSYLRLRCRCWRDPRYRLRCVLGR